MTRDFLMATIAALGLAACGPELSTETPPPTTVGGAPGAPANDPAVAQAGKSEEAPPGARDLKEGERAEDGEKPPR
jgi:hypothetical protein